MAIRKEKKNSTCRIELFSFFFESNNCGIVYPNKKNKNSWGLLAPANFLIDAMRGAPS